jgi:hypothetical protein
MRKILLLLKRKSFRPRFALKRKLLNRSEAKKSEKRGKKRKKEGKKAKK